MSKRPNKRVLVDGVFLGPTMKGVGRYVQNTLWKLADLDSENDFWVLSRQDQTLPPLPHNPRFHYVAIPYRNHYLHGFRVLPRMARRLHADVAWIPYETALGSLPCPYLILCHDIPRLISQAQAEAGQGIFLLRRILQRMDLLLLKNSLRKAARVFGNSLYVGEWLAAEMGIPGGCISHAPCAPGMDFAELRKKVDIDKVRRSLDSPRGYILAFYTGDGRENFQAVLEVYGRLVEEKFPQSLVIAGVPESDRESLESGVARFSWRGRVRFIPFLGTGREQDLADIYTAASVYFDPSLHEGFGMQVIEAMACGTPVVCSNRGALPEVAGRAAILVDPTDPGEMAEGLIRVLSNPELACRLTSWGEERSASFNWERTARAIWDGLLEAAT